jgi:outer membrane receptor protein involved in Fe transport
LQAVGPSACFAAFGLKLWISHKRLIQLYLSVIRMSNGQKQIMLQYFKVATKRNALLSLLVLMGAISQLARAQDTGGDNSTVIYPAAYFAEYSPVTAQDMLSRIPGVSSGGSDGLAGASYGGSGRGFGGGGGNEILVNGKRTAGKNNSTGGQLDRIAADQVDRIEIIRGTSGELDVRGSDQVINVVLFEELASSSISYELGLNQSRDRTYTPSGSLSYSGQRGSLGYRVNATSQQNYSNSLSKENSVLGDF